MSHFLSRCGFVSANTRLQAISTLARTTAIAMLLGLTGAADAYDGIMVVGAVDILEPTADNDFSATVPSGLTGTAAASNYGNCVDIWAPGDAIYAVWGNLSGDTVVGTTYSNIASIGGTSMAAPHVAAAAAYYADLYSLTSPSAIEQAIRSNWSRWVLIAAARRCTWFTSERHCHAPFPIRGRVAAPTAAMRRPTDSTVGWGVAHACRLSRCFRDVRKLCCSYGGLASVLLPLFDGHGNHAHYGCDFHAPGKGDRPLVANDWRWASAMLLRSSRLCHQR